MNEVPRYKHIFTLVFSIDVKTQSLYALQAQARKVTNSNHLKIMKGESREKP